MNMRQMIASALLLMSASAGVSTQGASTFVVPEERIAVFDNDGTLWAQQPLYFQFLFMLDQVNAAAPKHPEWKNDPAFRPSRSLERFRKRNSES